MRKWGFAKPGLSVTGSPSDIGYPEPAYGSYGDLEQGEVITFRAPAVCTNDSGTLYVENLGWTLIDDNFAKTAGETLETSITYGEGYLYSSFVWMWSDSWKRVERAKKAPVRLPGAYRAVEYLEQVANGGVSTGIKLTTNTTEVAFTIGRNEDPSFSGGYASDTKWIGAVSGPTVFSLGRYQSKWRLCANGSGWSSPAAYADSFGPLTVVVRGVEWAFIPEYEDGFKIVNGEAHLVGNVNGTQPIGIFNPTGGGYAPAGARIYGLRIFEKGECVRDLVPCYRRKVWNESLGRYEADAEQTPGYYDLVTGEFFPRTTGSLTCGPETLRPDLKFLIY